MTEVAELAHIIPPQQARSQRFLVKVLEAAETIMRRDGVEGLTMPAVAQEAGVSVGGIYRRFQTKQDLLRAIKDRFLTRAEQSVADALEGRTRSLDDVVRNFIDTILKGGPGADLFGLMVESNLEGGNQPIPPDLSQLRYGRSVTDPCVDWGTTETMIHAAHDALREVLPARRGAAASSAG